MRTLTNHKQLLMYGLHSKIAQLTEHTLILTLKALITLRANLFAEHESSKETFARIQRFKNGIYCNLEYRRPALVDTQ